MNQSSDNILQAIVIVNGQATLDFDENHTTTRMPDATTVDLSYQAFTIDHL